MTKGMSLVDKKYDTSQNESISVCINSGCRYWRGTVCESKEWCIWRRK